MPRKADDEVGVFKQEFRTPRGRLIVEKRGKTIERQYFPYKDGKLAKNYDSIENIPIEYINKFVEQLYKPKRERRYLKREDWADPDQPFNSEINQSAKKLTPRVSPDHLRAFEEAAAKYPDKRAALERAVELLARDAGVRLPKPSLNK